MSAFASSSSFASSVARAPRTKFTVIACGKGGLGNGPGPKKKSKQKTWTYPSYVTSVRQKAAYRMQERRMRRDQNLENLGFHRCMICTKVLKRSEEVHCANQSCTAYFHKNCVEEWFRNTKEKKCPHCQHFFESFEAYFVRYNDFHRTLDQNFFDAENLHINISDTSYYGSWQLNIVPLVRQEKTMGYYFLQWATDDIPNVEYSSNAGGTLITDAVDADVRESLQNASNEAYTVQQACAELESLHTVLLMFSTKNRRSCRWEYAQGVTVMSELASNLTVAGMQPQEEDDEIDVGDFDDDIVLRSDFYYKTNSNAIVIRGYALATYIRAGGKIW